MEYRDYYADLGVPRTATADEIKSAFRKLARETHPDTHPDDPKAEDRFKRISEAYDVLGDTEKRSKYDNLSGQYDSFRRQGGRGGNTSWDAFQGANGVNVDLSDLFGGGSMSDFFQTIFGGQRQARQQRQRQPRQQQRQQEPQQPIYSVTLSLDEALVGVRKRLVLGNERIEVTFKPGIADGQRLKVPQGHLEVKLAPHGVFTREGSDLRRSVQCPLTTALLGGTLTVPTLRGDVAVKVAPGTTSGKTLRLRGQGMPVYGSTDERGDLYVTMDVTLPASLTDEQRTLVEQLRDCGL
jgi:curved DNA-binding protein